MSEAELATWEEVDEALGQLAELERQITELELQANERIDAVKAQLEEHSEPLRDAHKRSAARVDAWLRANRAAFSKERSKEGRFGSAGFRLSSSLTFAAKTREPDVLQALRGLGLHQCIRVTEKLDKNTAGQLTDDTLAKVGLRRKVSDEPWWEVKKEVALLGK
jgi:phage host-nuclease inhibitor protein Gam